MTALFRLLGGRDSCPVAAEGSMNALPAPWSCTGLWMPPSPSVPEGRSNLVTPGAASPVRAIASETPPPPFFRARLRRSAAESKRVFRRSELVLVLALVLALALWAVWDGGGWAGVGLYKRSEERGSPKMVRSSGLRSCDSIAPEAGRVGRGMERVKHCSAPRTA